MDGESYNAHVRLFKTMFICRFLLSTCWLRSRWCRGVHWWSLFDRIMSRNTNCYLLVIKSLKSHLYCVNNLKQNSNIKKCCIIRTYLESNRESLDLYTKHTYMNNPFPDMVQALWKAIAWWTNWMGPNQN